jgi:hypothetical protein
MAAGNNSFREEKLRFIFPPEWQVSQYDKTDFFRQQIDKVNLGKDKKGRHIGDPKGVDFVAQSPDGALWFIEVKDFLHSTEGDNSLDTLPNVVVKKTLDTMAGLWIAHRQGYNDFAHFAAMFDCAQPVHVVLWLEQADTAAKSRLNPPISARTNIEQALRSRLRFLGLKGKLGHLSIVGEFDWTVERIQ